MTIPEKHTISNYTIPEQLLTYNITLVVQEMVVGSILPDSHVYRKELINSISLLVIRNLNIKQCLLHCVCVCVFICEMFAMPVEYDREGSFSG